MNDKQAEAMLKSLKRMEQLLEAIDWKLWNFHQKVMGDTPETAGSVEDEETEQLAAVIDTPKAKPTAEKKAGFPSVEKWS
jgi:cob(I)alamin adenosyltransferase